MGAVRLLYDWNWAEAEKELKLALALNPNNADAHGLYANYLDAMKRLDESLSERKRAQELDPLSAVFNNDLGITFYYSRQYDEAIAQLAVDIGNALRQVVGDLAQHRLAPIKAWLDVPKCRA